MASLELTGRHVLDGSLISAFVPTGSASSQCLLTLSESNAASAGATAFCGQRVYRGARGVILRIYLPETPPSGIRLKVTVYHEGANRYGHPILYTG